jgi:hypothetical protein
VPTPPLPLSAEPSLEQLRNQARDLQRAVRSGIPEAIAEVTERHPRPPLGTAAVASFALSAAQLVIARRYGFDSWTRLKHRVELIERYSRFPSRLLFEFGLGTGDGGPWKRRMGDALEPPATMLRGELAWAITHGLAERVRLLAEHGVDLLTSYKDGTSTTAMAATTGHPELIEFLVSQGAPRPELSPVDAFVAAVLAVDRPGLSQLHRDHPGLADEVRTARPGLVVWAAATGRSGTVELLVELGFDVNAMGRADVPSDQPWQTALHRAAEDGDPELARTLLRLGADPDLKDARFGGTPLGWARHFDRQAIIELLEPVTTPEADPADEGHG